MATSSRRDSVLNRDGKQISAESCDGLSSASLLWHSLELARAGDRQEAGKPSRGPVAVNEMEMANRNLVFAVPCNVR